MLGFILSCGRNQNTFGQWAFQISLLSGRTVSRQGVFDRIGRHAVDFAEALLRHFLLQQANCCPGSGLFGHFGKVLLQDSTTLHLPQALSSVFKGNHSHGEQRAVARIQSVINIKSMRFLHFSLGSFTDNDQSASGSIVKWASAGDLVIRDLGYFALHIFETLARKRIYFLSRLRFGVALYDEKGRELPLKGLLRGKKILDRWVLMGKEKKIKVRLLMIPLPVEQAAERVRKARLDTDKRLNHSGEYYQWLGYTVLITNVEQQVWTPQQAAQAYRVRWQIEIVFKSWKSGFHLQQLLHDGCANEHRVKVNIYLLLLFICLFMQKVYVPYQNKCSSDGGKTISLLKLSKYIFANIKDVLSVGGKQLKRLLLKHCCYDERSDRIKMTDLYQILT